MLTSAQKEFYTTNGYVLVEKLLDLEYIDNWSLTQDLIIALKTIPVILKGSGK